MLRLHIILSFPRILDNKSPYGLAMERFYSLMVITADSDSADPGSIPGRTSYKFFPFGPNKRAPFIFLFLLLPFSLFPFSSRTEKEDNMYRIACGGLVY